MKEINLLWSRLLVLLLTLGLAVILAGVWVYASEPAPHSEADWIAQPTTNLPLIMGPEDARWNEVTPHYLPLHAGSHGRLTNEVVELQALYDMTRVAFRVRWSGPTSSSQAGPLFGLIWHKDNLPGQRGEDCATACHIVQSEGNDETWRGVVRPSFVPAGREEPLPSRAVWRDGTWTLTWSRLLRSPEARDIQFIDLNQRYRVRAKLFLDLNQKPDLLTEDTYLIFKQ